MININKLLYERLMIELDYEDGSGSEPTPEPTNRNQIDQSQISGDGIYSWRPVANLYGLADGYKTFCIYDGKLYKATADVVTSNEPPNQNSSFEEFKPSGVTIITGKGIKGDGTTDSPIETDVSLESDNLLFIDDSGQLYVSKTVIEDLIDSKVDNIDINIVTGFGINGSGKDGDPLEIAIADDENNIIVELNNALMVNKDDIKNLIYTAMQNVEIDSNVANIRSHRILTLKFNDPDDTRLYAYETVTKLEFDETTNELVYTDEKVEETRIPISVGSDGASKFTELTDTPDDISTDGKMLITSNNQLILSDLPSECGFVVLNNNPIFIKNGNDLTVNDIQQFINQAIEKIPVERTYGYVSVKCIDPKFELFPVNKGLIEYVKQEGSTSFNVRFNGLKQEFELIDGYRVRDYDFNVIHEFKDTDDNYLVCYAITQDGYKRLVKSDRKIYDLNSDGKYEDTGVTVNSSLESYEISLCGKYIVGKSGTNKLKICEFTDSSANTTTDTEITINEMPSDGYSVIMPNHNMVDDLIFVNQSSDGKTLRAFNVKLDLVNKTYTATEIFNIYTEFTTTYLYRSKCSMSYDRSIFAFMTDYPYKLILIVKDSDNSYRLVRTDLSITSYYGMAISNDNYFIDAQNGATKFYKINLAPSLFCINQRVENIVTTYNKQANQVAIITDTKYALVKDDGIYVWDITADSETKIIDSSDIKGINACATNIIYSYGTNGDGWIITDLDGNQIKSGSCSDGSENVDIVQTTNGYNYAIRDYVDGDNNPFKYIIKDQADNIILNQEYNYKLGITIKNYNTIIGVRSESGSDGTTIYITIIDSDGLTTGSVYYSGVEYEVFDIHSINDNIILNVQDSNGDKSNIILCIEDINNIVKCGTFADRSGCDCLYDTSLNNVVSISGTDILVLDYDR